MVKMLNQWDAGFAEAFAVLLDREGSTEQSVEAVVKDIIKDVRHQGDSALIEMTARFDGVKVADGGELELSPDLMADAQP